MAAKTKRMRPASAHDVMMALMDARMIERNDEDDDVKLTQLGLAYATLFEEPDKDHPLRQLPIVGLFVEDEQQ
jgi:hypothetical protein